MPRQHCTYCGANNHTKVNCPKTWAGSSNRLHLRCGYCGSNTHKRSSCPKIVAPHNRKPDDYIA